MSKILKLIFNHFYLHCTYHVQVKWNPVIWGLAIQFALGLFILRTKVGFYLFNFMGEVTETFMGYTSAGCIFVFGDNYQDHFFAFAVSNALLC